MTSFRMVRTDRKVERVPRVTLPVGHVDFLGERDGFTLVEVICVLAIIAILAAIALPAIPRGTSRPRLEGYALQTAAVLNADHNAARRQHTEIATVIDAPLRTIRSGASGRVVRLPSDITVEAMLAARCNQRPAGSTIRHFASGMSCGGVIALTRPGAGFQVRVNWLTGGVEVVPVN
jgi:general secretion pathway protein H